MELGPPIIGVSENIKGIRELINHVSDTALNVVISGESGVGKEVVAQKLYQNSPRLGKPFIKINCAALPEGLLESELFGFEPGAFTGAERKKRGKFELAHGGVLFLDEIGDMSLPLQSKLLHVLQHGEFSPLGSEKDVKADTWVIAATNHELEKDVQERKFREDLYYRLNIIKIHIAPLRERPEDIPQLVDYYLREYSKQFKCKDDYQLTDIEIERLMNYPWPGNVRELQNVLKRILVLGNCEKTILELESNCINNNINGAKPASQANRPTTANVFDLGDVEPSDLNSFSLKKIKKKAVDRVEKEVIEYVLGKTGWNRSKAAKILKISYKALLYKISDLNIEPPAKA